MSTITTPIILPNDTSKNDINNWIKQQNEYDADKDEKGNLLGKYFDNIVTSNMDYINMSMKNIGIWGAPYQFNSYADVPSGTIYNNSTSNKYIGRCYEEKILANAPIVYFEVGKPQFMAQLNKDKSVTSYVMNLIFDAANNVSAATDALDGQEAILAGKTHKLRYYGFEDAFTSYANYVNAMARFTAIKMGLGSKISPTGKAYRAYDISQIKNRLMITSTLTATALGGFVGAGKQAIENVKNALSESNWHIPFYCNAQSTSVSENINNSTGESMLSSTLKSSSQLMKEISFILDTTVNDDIVASNTKTLQDTIENLTGGLGESGFTGLLKNISNGLGTIVSGANMMMPLIWQDSTFSKSYSISIHLSTPYGDPEAVFNDIYVPLFCILAMSMPRQTSDYGYSAPFIIKAHSKGYFNCDMGMIESVDIKRGGQEGVSWTKDSFPTELDININIKDLYPAIVMTQARTSSFAFAGNTGLVEYLNMMAGLNLSAIRPASNISAAISMLAGDIQNIPNTIERNVSHAAYKGIKNFINNYLP